MLVHGPQRIISDAVLRYADPRLAAGRIGRIFPVATAPDWGGGDTGVGPGVTGLCYGPKWQGWADIVGRSRRRAAWRNNRITASKFLNQNCASASDLESMLPTRTPKIILQREAGRRGYIRTSHVIGHFTHSSLQSLSLC